MEIVLYMLILLLAKSSIAKKSSQGLMVNWDTFDCIANPSIVEFHRCVISEPDKSLITAEIKYNREFKQINANFILKLPRPPSKEYHKILDINLDLCQFQKASKQNKFVNIAYKSLKMHSQPIKCPQPKGFYYFRNMNIGAHLPPFLPKKEFLVQLNIYIPNIPLLNVSLSGRLLDSRSSAK